MIIIEKSVLEVFNDSVLNEAAKRYGIAREDLKFIRDFENFVYEYEKNNQNYIMRLTHSSHRTEALIHDEAKWIKYLYDNHAKVSNVVYSNNDSLVETINVGSSDFFVTVFEKAAGKEVDRTNPAEWNEKLFETWGQVVGNFHRLSKNYDPALGIISRYQWFEDDLIQNAEKYLEPIGDIVIRKQKELMKWMMSLPQDVDSYGLAHTDVHDGNFFVHDGEMTVFDFDDCSYNWFMNDISIVLFYVLFYYRDLEKQQRSAIAEKFMNNFWIGYKRENHIDDKWLSCIPKFLKFREMLVFTVLCKKWDFDNLNEKQVKMIDQMRFNIENDVPYI